MGSSAKDAQFPGYEPVVDIPKSSSTSSLSKLDNSSPTPSAASSSPATATATAATAFATTGDSSRDKPTGRAPSTVSEVPNKGYSIAELAEYAAETTVNGFLAVSVMRGDMLTKGEGGSKLHHSYDVRLCFLVHRILII